MSSTPGLSALAHTMNDAMIDASDMRDIKDDIHKHHSADENMASIADSARIDTTFNVITGMIVIATLSGNNILATFSAVFIIIAIKITTPEVIHTDSIQAQQADITIKADTTATYATISESYGISNFPTAHYEMDISSAIDTTNDGTDRAAEYIDTIPIAPTEACLHKYRHILPTFDIVEVITPATTSDDDTKSATSEEDSDCFGTLTSDVFNCKAFEKIFAEDRMYLVQLITPNPAITTTVKAKLCIPMQTEIKRASLFDPKPRKSTSNPMNNQIKANIRIVGIPLFNAVCKLPTIYEVEEEEVESALPEIKIGKSR